jgi:spore germination cell wall hydrolase CwlJ-like protein
MGAAAVLVVSILMVSNGLAASAHDGHDQNPTVQAATIDAVAPRDPPTAQSPSPKPLNAAAPATSSRRQMALATLSDLVAIRAAHPRAVGPDTVCLARTVYLEASNQTLRGQLAVAQVVLNRMKSATYPKSACAVVGQPGQFAQPDQDPDPAVAKPWNTAVAIARIAQDGHVPQVAPGAMFFHATYVSPAWSQTHERIAQIGDHVFYR